MLQAGRLRDRVPIRWIFSIYLILPDTMALGSTQPLREMSTMNLPGVKGQPARKADNLSGKCGILDVLQPYGSSQLVKGIAVPFLYIQFRLLYRSITLLLVIRVR
jgi:hypothetical protein